MRIVMMGTGGFAVPTFQKLLTAPTIQVVGLFTQPDRNVGARRSSTRQAVVGMKDVALEHNIPVFQPENINLPPWEEQLRELQPDLYVVAAYGQILKAHILNVPTHGAINVHASLLPKYRGASPIVRAIQAGDAESGVTIIRLNTGLDAGEMLARQSTPIGATENAGELEERLAMIGADLACQTIDQIRLGTTHGIPQDLSLVTKAPKLTKEEGLIPWERSKQVVDCHIRAMQPWPAPFTWLHRPGKPSLRIIVPRVGVPAAPPADEMPTTPGGLIATPKQLKVRTGDGWLEILEVQPAGKKRMLAEEFLRGHPIGPGDYVGPEFSTDPPVSSTT
ncbi:MAG: methionyl-tRNA formyltransferase [Zavarzinella sp.]